MSIHAFPPRPGRFEEVLASAKRAADRHTLRAWADGYCIYDRDELIATFHGPQLALASRLLRLLQEDAARGPEPKGAA